MNALDRLAEMAREISAVSAAIQRDLTKIRAMAIEELARREAAARIATADTNEGEKP